MLRWLCLATIVLAAAPPTPEKLLLAMPPIHSKWRHVSHPTAIDPLRARRCRRAACAGSGLANGSRRP